RVPGQEALLEAQPDFVFAGWESNFAADAAGERSALAEFGVTTYVAPAACQAPEYRPDPLTFDHVFDGFTELAAIFGVPEQAEALIAQQRDQLATVDEPGAGLTALW